MTKAVTIRKLRSRELTKKEIDEGVFQSGKGLFTDAPMQKQNKRGFFRGLDLRG